MKLSLNRASVIEQATNHLRERLLAGQWKEILPGERTLSAQLGISRPSLREALKVLEDEGLLSGEPNHSRRVLTQSTTLPQHQHRLTFLTGQNPSLIGSSYQTFQTELRYLLHERNILTDEVSHPSFGRGKADKMLEAFVKPDPHHHWALALVSRNVQNWFQKNRLPTLVIGSVYPEIQLPSFDLDHRGICRHAVGSLIRLGHRRIMLVMPIQPKAGDQESEIGFSEAFHQSDQQGLEPKIIFVRTDPNDLRKKLKTVLHSARPPTALITCYSSLTLTALTYCQAIGCKVPGDLSIISGDSAAYFDFVFPNVCRYTHTDAVFTQKLFALLIKLTAGEKLPPKKHLIVPRFVAADSTAPPSR